MKKKASFLISGITTVALLAVAVGSFAAWNTLSASANNLQVSTSTPVELTVTGASASGDEVKTLIPSDTTAVSSKEASEIKVGTLTAKLAGITSDTDLDSIELTKGVYDTAEGATSNNDYVVILKDGENEKDTILPSDIATESGKTYDVYVKFADSVNDANASTNHKGQNKFVKISLEAKKSSPAT